MRMATKEVDPDMLISSRQIQDRNYKLLPAQTVHTGENLSLRITRAFSRTKYMIDCTDYSLRNRTYKFLGADAESLLKGRVRMVR
jgi:hypothetical protein